MLNSLWGKFAQRSNLVKTEQIQDPQLFFDYLTSDEINVLDADLVSDDIVEIRHEYTDNFIQTDAKTNVVIAAFTTAHARLMLYEELDMLKERVLYYDTDSIIYLTKLGEPEPRLGNYIGEMTDEREAIISPYSRWADQRIIVIRPTQVKSRPKYAASRWTARRERK